MAVTVPDYIYALQERVPVGAEVRRQHGELVEKLVALGQLAQANGIAALEGEVASLRESEPFLWQHLGYLIEGVDVEFWKELVLSQMSLHVDEPEVLFHELVCFWGVFDLWRGVSPRLMAQRLALFVGEGAPQPPAPPLTPTNIANLDALLVPDDLEEL